MTAFERTTAALLAVGCRGRGGSWTCPAHEDRNPSLSVTNGGGKVLIKCQAGCSLEDILERLGLAKADLFDEPLVNDRPRIVAEYDYLDEKGELLFQVVRYDPKAFRQRRPADGGWAWKLGDVRRVPYRLPQLLDGIAEGAAVFVVEGEKDVHALEDAGYVATCNAGGAGKWLEQFTGYLRGAPVVYVVADKDEPGYAHARAVRDSCARHGVPVVLCEAAEGFKDVAEHLGAGRGVEDLLMVVEEPEVPEVAEEAPANPFLAAEVNWDELFNADNGPEWLLEPFLARGRTHAVFAVAGVGKSFVVLAAAAALASGRAFLSKPQTEPQHVLYCDYEMTPDDVRDRLMDFGYGPGELGYLHYCLLPVAHPLDTEQGAAEIVEAAEAVGAVLVVIDTAGRAVGGEENEADTYRALARLTMLRLKSRGMTVVRVDHAGKNAEAGQRGSSAKNDDVDVVWRVNKVDGNGRVLEALKRRVNWVPELVALDVIEAADGCWSISLPASGHGWPAGTKEAADALDELGADEDIGSNAAVRLLREAGRSYRRQVVLAAVRWRKCDPRRMLGFAESVRKVVPEPAGTAGTEVGNSGGNQDEENF